MPNTSTPDLNQQQISAQALQVLPEAKDGKCSTCAGSSFVLAEDYTDYGTYQHQDGGWEVGCTSTQPTGAEKSVRFYCAQCGTHHQVPKEVA